MFILIWYNIVGIHYSLFFVHVTMLGILSALGLIPLSAFRLKFVYDKGGILCLTQ